MARNGLQSGDTPLSPSKKRDLALLAKAANVIANVDNLTAVASNFTTDESDSDLTMGIGEIAASVTAFFMILMFYCLGGRRLNSTTNIFMTLLSLSCLLSIIGGILLLENAETESPTRQQQNLGVGLTIGSKLLHPLASSFFSNDERTNETLSSRAEDTPLVTQDTGNTGGGGWLGRGG